MPPAGLLPIANSVPAMTRRTVGASLKPDSVSRDARTLGGSDTPRSTEKTAAASVGATTAPSRKATARGSPRTK